MKKYVLSVLAFVLLAVLFGGCTLASTSIPPTFTPLPTDTPVPTLAPTNTLVPTETLPNPFTGTWDGVDPYDGSNTVIILVQTGNDLLGTYEDSFSLNVNPPGYYGEGSGTISSTTTAQMVFDLSRWDGQTGRFSIHLTLSNDANTLTISDCLWDNSKDTEDCPIVMQRK